MEFTSRYPAALALLFLVISIAVSFYLYRKTPVSSPKKYLLGALKSAAIFLTIVLFIEPSILAFMNPKNNSVNLVIIDNTRSNMLNSENGSLKSTEIKNFLNNNFSDLNKYSLFTLNGTGKGPENIKNIDSIKFEGAVTNLSESLNMLLAYFPEKNFNTVTVISDGIFNSGGNPFYQARLFEAPFLTIGVGDTVQKKDAVLKNIYYGNKAFTGTNNLIKAFIQTYGLQNQAPVINLLKEGNVIQSKNIQITSQSQSEEIDFDVIEQKPGIVKYSIEISEQPGELNFENNKEQFLVQYIDNKTNLMVISSGPGYDNSAVTEILKRIGNYNVTLRTVKNQNEFYEGPLDFKIFGELSAVFLLGFPAAQFSSEINSNIALKINEFNIPVIFFAQKNTDYKKLEIFDEFIPFTVIGSNSGEKEFFPQVVASPDNGFIKIEQDINSTPQIFCNVTGIIPKAGTVTQITNKSNGEPVFITRKTGKINSSAFLGYGLWRWNMNQRAAHEKTIENFLTQSVNQTLLKDKKTKFTIYADKDVSDYTENINLTAEVFDDEYKPSRNAKVTAKILLNGNKVLDNILLTPYDNKYTVSVPPLSAGDYTIEAEADLNNNFYANDNSRFLVDSLNTEYLKTTSDFESLRELADKTGGEFFRINQNSPDIISRINAAESNTGLEKQTVRKKEYFNLRENKYILLLIIFLFTAEWILKKRNNIP